MGIKNAIGGGEKVKKLIVDIPTSKEDKLIILKMAEEDIKYNNIASKKKTSLAYLNQVIKTSTIVHLNYGK